VIDPYAKDQFWNVVEDCLREIFQLDPQEAHSRSKKLRQVIETPRPAVSDDIFYHDEPFDVASDLADRPPYPDSAHPELARYRQQYDAILKRHQW
jgi:hypothetical protein